MPVTGRTETLGHSASEGITCSTEGQAEQLCDYNSVIPPANVVESPEPPVPLAANESNDVPVNPLDCGMLCGIENYVSKAISLIPEDDGLPPLLLARGGKGERKFPLTKVKGFIYLFLP